MEIMIIDFLTSFSIFVEALNDEALIPQEVSHWGRLCEGNYGNVGPETLQPINIVSNIL